MSRQVVFHQYGGPEVLRVVDGPALVASHGQIRVRVRAAGVNRGDCRIRRGEFAGESDRFPQTLGNEFSGIVDQVGPGVTGVAVGDEVLGFTTAAAPPASCTFPYGSSGYPKSPRPTVRWRPDTFTARSL